VVAAIDACSKPPELTRKPAYVPAGYVWSESLTLSSAEEHARPVILIETN
jgi:hypothetical protein